MKRKLFGGISIAVLCTIATVCGVFFSATAPVKANAIIPGFTYEGPTGAKGDKGSINIGYNNTINQHQVFNLGVRDFGKTKDPNPPTLPDNTIASQTRVHNAAISGTPNYVEMPVFNNANMSEIAKGNTPRVLSHNEDGEEILEDYGFVMLKSGEQIVLEITNLLFLHTTDIDTMYVKHDHGAEQKIKHEAIVDIVGKAKDNPNQLWYNNAVTIAGVFDAEGHYEFQVVVAVSDQTSARKVVLRFSFYIVLASSYSDKPDLKQGASLLDPTNTSGKYFYNFMGPEPYLMYDNNRFRVGVTANDFFGLLDDDFEPTITDNKTRYDFVALGDYFVSAEIVYWDDILERTVKGPFSVYQYSLNIYGVQAYYENYDVWDADKHLRFGGKEDNEGNIVNADISDHELIDYNNLVTGIAMPSNFSVGSLSGSTGIIAKLKAADLHVATTNAPPVVLRTNVLPSTTRQSQVFFNGGKGWESLKYDKDGLYQKAGEYFVVVYYTYEIESPNEQRQVFYFKINNFVDARVEASGGEVYYFDEYVDRTVNLNDNAFVVYVHNGDRGLSPYEMTPNIIVAFYEWGTQNDAIPVGWVVDGEFNWFPGFITDGKLKDGNYIFRIIYGNKYLSFMDFTVRVDREAVKDLSIDKLGLRGGKLDLEQVYGYNEKKFEVFGGEGVEVEIQWAEKTSKLGFDRTASVYHYGFGGDSDVEIDDYFGFGGSFPYDYYSEEFFSPYYLDTSDVIKTMTPHIIAKDGGGWKLSETFTDGGLYFVYFKDVVGNETRFAFIIDNTPAAFAQDRDPKIKDKKANIQEGTTNVGFGQRKKIEAKKGVDLSVLFGENGLTKDVYEKLHTKLFSSDNKNILINIDKHEVSTDNVNFEGRDPKQPGNPTITLNPADSKPITVQYTGGKYMTLSDEAFYFLRSTDALGNKSMWYVWINKDKCRGMILEDEEPRASGMTGMSSTASLVRPDGMARMEYLYFAFETTSDEPSATSVPGFKYTVDTIMMTHYAFDLFTTPYDSATNPTGNKNYPFSESGTPRVIYTNDDNTSNVPSVPFHAGQFPLGTAYLPINQIRPGTTEGLYVITRFYDLDQFVYGSPEWTAAREVQVKSYFFIVDRNSIIPIAGNFRSDIRVKFGAKTAQWNHLNVEIQTNTNAQLMLPAYQTKYGANPKLGGKGDSGQDGLKYYEGAFLNTDKPSNTIVLGSGEILMESGDIKFGRNFPVLNLNATSRYNGGSASEMIFPNPPNSHRDLNLSNELYEKGKYEIQVTDGSGGINWIPYGKGSRTVKPNSATIRFEILTGQAKAEWLLNDKPLPTGRTSAKVEQGDTLKFAFSNNESDFFATVDPTRTEWSGVSSVPPVTRTEEHNYVPLLRSTYTYNLTDPDNNKIVTRDEDLHVRLYADGLAVPIDYKIKIDVTPPSYNFIDKPNSVRKVDRLYNSLPTLHRNYPDYVYSIPSDFRFEYKDIHDTHTIMYQEMDTDLVTKIGGYRYFDYGNTKFADVLADNGDTLTANQSRVFQITETDEAGNDQVYFVRVVGNTYNAALSVTDESVNNVTNLLPRSNEVFGSNIKINDSLGYWNSNPCFKWMYRITEAGNWVEFLRIKDRHNDIRTGAGSFDEFVTKMLKDGNNKYIDLRINDGFDYSDRQVIISQVSGSQLRQSLVSRATGPGGENLEVELTNWNELTTAFPTIKFTLHVYTIMENNSTVHHETRQMTSGTSTFMGIGQRDLEIRVEDSFGRIIRIQHHSPGKDYRQVIYEGTTRIINGTRYVGHENGATVYWNPMVYEVIIRVNNVEISTNNAFTDGNGNRMFSITPRVYGERASVVVVFRYWASGVTAEVAAWEFYSVLPELLFKNINGGELEKAENPNGIIVSPETGGSVAGMVEINLSRSGFIVDSTISYTRTFGGQTETVLKGQYVTRISLEQVGVYEVIIKNTVSAEKIYRFTITDVTNLSYKVMFNGVELEESPAGFDYRYVYSSRLDTNGGIIKKTDNVTPQDFIMQGGSLNQVTNPGNTLGESRKIPVFWVPRVNNTNQIEITDFTTMKNSSGSVQIVPSLNNRRELVKVGTLQQNLQNTAWWQFYYLYSEVTGARLYFVLASTSTTPDSRGVEINRTATGNPVNESGIVYALYRTNPSGIRLSLLLPADNPNDVLATNVYYAKYYHNGQYCGTLFGNALHGKNILTLTESDYGVFEFEIFDWAGNQREWIIPSGQPAPGNYKKYTVYNFARAPILINGETIIDEMVYNDRLVISAIGVMPFVEANGTHFFFSRMDVWHDGEKVEEFPARTGRADTKHDKTSFTYSESGRYTIVCEYNIGGSGGGGRNGARLVTTTHTVNLVNRNQILPAFTFSGASNINITNIKHYSRDVTRMFGTAPIKSFSINPKTNPLHGGSYQITFQIDANNVRDKITMTRDIHVWALDESYDNIVYTANSKQRFGGTYKSDVAVTFNLTRILSAAEGVATVRVLHNGVELKNDALAVSPVMEIDEKFVNVLNPEEEEVIIMKNYKKLGQYQIVVHASSGDLIFADGFSIEKGMNTILIVIIIGAVVVVVFGIFVFIRLRTRMRVK